MPDAGPAAGQQVLGRGSFGLFRFRRSGLAFGIVLLAFMIPFQAVLTPLFLELHFLHLLNRLIGLALFCTTFNLPVGVYVMRNSFLQVPREIIDAARVDEALVMKTLVSVLRPLVLPGIAMAALPCGKRRPGCSWRTEPIRVPEGNAEASAVRLPRIAGRKRPPCPLLRVVFLPFKQEHVVTQQDE